MAGKLVPLVVLPRFSSFANTSPGLGFHTVPIEVSDYQKAVLTVWRGPVESGTEFSVSCQESTDQQTWTQCAGTNTGTYDPGVNAEGVVVADLKKRWLRVNVFVANPPSNRASATCWMAGHLVVREK